MVIAIKFNEDEFYSSEFYAKLGGISKAEMNFMEYEFLSMIDFNLFVLFLANISFDILHII